MTAESPKRTLAEQIKARKEAKATQQEKPVSLSEKLRMKRENQEQERPLAPSKPADKDALEKAASAVKPIQADEPAKPAKPAKPNQGEDDDVPPPSTNLEGETLTAFQTTLTELNTRYDDLKKRVQLTDMARQVNELKQKLDGLPQALSAIRKAGYIYEADLEAALPDFAPAWDELNQVVQTWLTQTHHELDDELAIAERLNTRSQGTPTTAHQAVALQWGNILTRIAEQVEVVEEHIKAEYGPLSEDVSAVKATIDRIQADLDIAKEASFSFSGDEKLYRVEDAEWQEGKKPDGNLYLTNQRLMFEQDEKTGGMMGFGGKKVKELLWEVPLTSIQNIEAESKGMFGGKDLITLTLGAGSRYGKIVFEIKGGIRAQEWADEITAAKAGQLK